MCTLHQTSRRGVYMCLHLFTTIIPPLKYLIFTLTMAAMACSTSFFAKAQAITGSAVRRSTTTTRETGSSAARSFSRMILGAESVGFPSDVWGILMWILCCTYPMTTSMWYIYEIHYDPYIGFIMLWKRTYPMTDPWCWYINANIKGVYWWDPWSTIYSSNMDPMGMRKNGDKWRLNVNVYSVIWRYWMFKWMFL